MQVSGYFADKAALPPGMNCGNHLVVDWVGPRAGQNISKNRQIFWYNRDSYPDNAARSTVAILTTLLRLPVKTLQTLHEVYKFRCYSFNALLMTKRTAYIQDVSETGDHILGTYLVGQNNKPHTKMFRNAHDLLKYQKMRKAAQLLTLQDGHFEQMLWNFYMCTVQIWGWQ